MRNLIHMVNYLDARNNDSCIQIRKEGQFPVNLYASQLRRNDVHYYPSSSVHNRLNIPTTRLHLNTALTLDFYLHPGSRLEPAHQSRRSGRSKTISWGDLCRWVCSNLWEDIVPRSNKLQMAGGIENLKWCREIIGSAYCYGAQVGSFGRQYRQHGTVHELRRWHRTIEGNSAIQWCTSHMSWQVQEANRFNL